MEAERRDAEREHVLAVTATNPPGRSSTRRRLVAAFSLVLTVIVAALAVHVARLRRMEETFESMERHEAVEHLALQLEEAVRSQYAEGERLLGSRSPDAAAYESARALALGRLAALRAGVEGPQSLAWVDEIVDATDRLDAMFREGLARGTGKAETVEERELRHRLVFTIEQNVDRVFTELQAEPIAFRRELVALERSAVRWTAGLIAAAPFLVLMVALYLSRSIARPLARLSEGAAAVRSGRLDTRIHIDSRDEFGALAAEFNAMTAALARHQERLVETEKLASIGRVAAGVAHELNNPLQVMLGYLSLDQDVGDPELRDHLAAAQHEALRCKGIVEDLLELARPMLVRVPVDLRRVCDDVVRGLRVALNGTTARLSVRGTASAIGDPTKLRQVIFNLVKNASEAAGPEGDVVVALRARHGRAEVEVADDGPGVSPENRGKIFEPFFTTKDSGKGLGLAVSRAFALAHGGDILVTNRNPHGAVFTLEVPRAPERRT